MEARPPLRSVYLIPGPWPTAALQAGGGSKRTGGGDRERWPGTGGGEARDGTVGVGRRCAVSRISECPQANQGGGSPGTPAWLCSSRISQNSFRRAAERKPHHSQWTEPRLLSLRSLEGQRPNTSGGRKPRGKQLRKHFMGFTDVTAAPVMGWRGLPTAVGACPSARTRSCGRGRNPALPPRGPHRRIAPGTRF